MRGEWMIKRTEDRRQKTEDRGQNVGIKLKFEEVRVSPAARGGLRVTKYRFLAIAIFCVPIRRKRLG